MIEIYLLEQLHAFAQYGTLTKAAEQLHISQPALTRSMKKLEEQFGVPLFVRDQRKLTLNQTGLIAASYAERILNDEKEMAASVLTEDRRSRMIMIGSCSTAATTRLLPLVQKNFGNMSILSEYEDDSVLIEKLKNHLEHLIILHHTPTDSGIMAQHFLDEQLYVSVPAHHPLARKKELHAEDLKDVSILGLDLPFWTNRLKEKLPDTLFMIQSNMDILDELADNPSLLLINSDLMLEDGYIPAGKTSIPIAEDFAKASYYVCCLEAEKERYAMLFNNIRVLAIHG